jgi:hypothetical protein
MVSRIESIVADDLERSRRVAAVMSGWLMEHDGLIIQEYAATPVC